MFWINKKYKIIKTGWAHEQVHLHSTKTLPKRNLKRQKTDIHWDDNNEEGNTNLMLESRKQMNEWIHSNWVEEDKPRWLVAKTLLIKLISSKVNNFWPKTIRRAPNRKHLLSLKARLKLQTGKLAEAINKEQVDA